MSRLYRPRTLALLIILLVLAALSYGFAASNTVTAQNVGDGSSAAISGFTLSVSWILDSTDPSINPTGCLDFSVGAPNNVYIQVEDSGNNPLGGGTGWLSCTSALTNCGAGIEYECDLSSMASNVNVSAITYVQVVAGE